ncbi:uncharacterized protein LOC134829916 [Culicoides brevitarsis]|uniref:uncharacterized protein LOC134829916 n=1 Tax=Culicoides brevitarsis TaxID=469753 RepID=UPI00307B8A42
MWKSVAICFFVVTLVQIHANLDFKAIDKQQFDKIVEKCKIDFNMTEDLDITETNELQKANDTSEEFQNVQCYVHCIVNEAFPEHLRDNGSFIPEKVGFDPNAKENEDIMQCFREEGKDVCETTFKQFICSFGLILVKTIQKFLEDLAKGLEELAQKTPTQ